MCTFCRCHYNYYILRIRCCGRYIAAGRYWTIGWRGGVQMSRYPITWKRKKPKRNSTVTMVWLIAKGKRSKRVKSTAVFRPARVVGITFSLAELWNCYCCCYYYYNRFCCCRCCRQPHFSALHLVRCLFWSVRTFFLIYVYVCFVPLNFCKYVCICIYIHMIWYMYVFYYGAAM